MRAIARLTCVVLTIMSVMMFRVPLAQAQFSDSWEFLKALDERDYEEMRSRLTRGANINIPDEGGNPGLMIAAIDGDMRLMRFIIDQGGDPNVRTLGREDTVFMRCAETGNIDCMRFLIESGADMDIQNRSGETALMRAVRARKRRAVTIMLEAGVDFETPDYTGRTALDHARAMRASRIVRALEAAGAR